MICPPEFQPDLRHWVRWGLILFKVVFLPSHTRKLLPTLSNTVSFVLRKAPWRAPSSVSGASAPSALCLRHCSSVLYRGNGALAPRARPKPVLGWMREAVAPPRRAFGGVTPEKFCEIYVQIRGFWVISGQNNLQNYMQLWTCWAKFWVNE